MPYRKPLFILAFVTLFAPFFAPFFAGALENSYMLDAWTVEEGLPRNSVLCLLQDKTGYIWLGTQSGLARFDGAAFRIYNRWNTPPLKQDKITALYEDKHGALWVGTGSGGLYRKINENWNAFTIREGLSNNDIRTIYPDGKGNLWIGTANGLNRLDMENEKIEVYAGGENFWGNTVTAMCARHRNRDGGIWVGTYAGGLFILENGIFSPRAPGGKTLETEITALYEDRGGRLWIGTEDGLLWLENGRLRTPVPEEHPLAGNTVRSLMEDAGGSVWAGTDGEGVYRWNGSRFTAASFHRDYSLNDDFIYAFLRDRENNLWVGTYASGLVRLTLPRVTAITTENGLPQNLVTTLMEDEHGLLWVGSRKGIAKIKDNHTTGTILPAVKVTALYRDKNGVTWVGTQKKGIIRLGKDHTRYYTTKDGLVSDEITVIAGDGNGAVRVGTSGGLNRFENGRFSISAKSVYINTLAEDNRHILWIGTPQGLMQLKDGRPEYFATGAGEKIPYDIVSLYPGKNGCLWAGTRGSGLIRLKDGAFTRFTTENGLPDNYIFGILEDNRANLWLGTNRGVCRVSPGQLEAVAQKKIPALTPLCLDEKDGMRSSECVAGGQPSACRTTGGLLCFPTVKGVALIDPAAIEINRVLPGVLIEKVIADNKPVNPGKEAVFPPETTVIEFHFTALSFTAPGKVKLRYKLDGNDDQWMEIAPRGKRMALYLNLAPGNYRFNVIACNNDGVWNEKGAVFRFKIDAPFYKGALFYGLILLAAAAVLFRQFNKRKARKAPRGKDGKEGGGDDRKYKTSALLPETVDDVLPRLTALIEKEKIFLQADLTLKTLSERLNVHYNHLSRIVNEQFKQNFNDFINKYRIEEAKQKLSDPSEGKKTILEIAYETGFYSKSVFNTAFKKFTGKTPSQYRKEMSEAPGR